MICAGNPLNSEFTLCGDAFDMSQEAEGAVSNPVATPGEQVTCEKCQRVIAFCKTFKNYVAQEQQP